MVRLCGAMESGSLARVLLWPFSSVVPAAFGESEGEIIHCAFSVDCFLVCECVSVFLLLFLLVQWRSLASVRVGALRADWAHARVRMGNWETREFSST